MLEMDGVQKNRASAAGTRPHISVPRSEFKAAFAQTMKLDTRQASLAQMDELVKDGERLTKRRTAADLRAYKKRVRACVQHLVSEGLGLSQTTSTSSGRLKQYKLVEQIDEELVLLTRDVFDKQKSELDLLNRIGELKGLLIQLYL